MIQVALPRATASAARSPTGTTRDSTRATRPGDEPFDVEDAPDEAVDRLARGLDDEAEPEELDEFVFPEDP